MMSQDQDNTKPTSDGQKGSNVVDSKLTTAVGDSKDDYRKPGLKGPLNKEKKAVVTNAYFAHDTTSRGLRGLRKNRRCRSQYHQGVDVEQQLSPGAVDADLDIGLSEEKIEEDGPITVSVATAVTEDDMKAEIRRQVIAEAVLGEAVVLDTRLRICGFPSRKVKCFGAGLAIVVLIWIASGVASSLSRGSGSDGITLTPATTSPTVSPTNTYWKGGVAPDVYLGVGGNYFDHFAELGLTVTGESNIHKMEQIQVFTTIVCSDSNCTFPTGTETVLTLVVVYRLKDCSTVMRRVGAYTEEEQGFHPAASINLMNNEFITRIEVMEEEETGRLRYINICTSDDQCFGPYGTSLDAEPTTVFENEFGGAIHSFYGYSGSWIDNLGVYYENFAYGGVMANTTCG